MDTKKRKLMMIRLGAGLVLLLALAFLGWYIFGPSGEEAPKQSQLGPSDEMVPVPPAEGAKAQPGRLVAEPQVVQFATDKPDTIVFTLRAEGGPVTIAGAQIPTADTDVLKVANLDCPAAPAMLPAGQSCTASVTWNGQRTVSTAVGVTTTARGPNGTDVPTTQNIAVTGTSTNPNQPAAGGQAGGQAGAQNGANGQVDALPAQQVPAPADQAGQGAQAQVASGPSPRQQAREAYLYGRRGAGITVANAPLQAAARSPYTSWDNVGVQGFKSSFPVDMSRVVTPDKPMTAVLTYQIDTRQVVTAVAMVDRDVYGSSGRTVVIPRGTKIIGRIGSGSTDRVGIAWNQLIRPDGVRFVFQGESGDAMGRGGVPGRVNNRYLERYGYSIIPSAISAGITAALGGQTATNQGGLSGSSQTQDAGAVAAQILSQPLQQIGQDIYQKKSQIPVQITIPAGTRVTIWSTGDLRLKPVGEDDAAQDRSGQAQQQQGQTSVFGAPRQAQGFGANQGAGAGQTSYSAPQQSQSSAQQGDGASEGNASSLQVGRVDANGNYIAPGANAPAPGPLLYSGNAAANGSAAAPAGAAAPNATNGAGATFPANRNPWQ